MHHFQLVPQNSKTEHTAETDLVDRIWRHGVATLSDAELLSILLRYGNGAANATEEARAVLHACNGSLAELCRTSPYDLMQLPGIGRRRTTMLLACAEFARRRYATDPRSRPLVSTSVAAHDILKAHLADLHHEEFWVLLTDRGNRMIDVRRISQGGMHGTVADSKLIFKAALERRASGLVLAHNHPSGQLRPSEEDIRLTRKLLEAGRFLDISVQDHLILTQHGYYSFADNGMLR